MNLSNRSVCEVLEYASNNNYVVELRPNCAVIDGFHGNQFFVIEQRVEINLMDSTRYASFAAIYNGKIEDSCIITIEEFKRLFVKR